MTDRLVINEPAAGLHEALCRVQSDLPHVAKSETADTGKFKYDYASLADINAAMLPVLAAEQLTWTCLPDVPAQTMVGVLTHAPSGESVEATWGLPQSRDPQQLGSAITYGRRYLLAAVVGLVPDGDDDGAAASRGAQQPKPKPAAPVEEVPPLDDFLGAYPDLFLETLDLDKTRAYAAQSAAHLSKALEQLEAKHGEWKAAQDDGWNTP